MIYTDSSLSKIFLFIISSGSSIQIIYISKSTEALCAKCISSKSSWLYVKEDVPTEWIYFIFIFFTIAQ